MQRTIREPVLTTVESPSSTSDGLDSAGARDAEIGLRFGGDHVSRLKTRRRERPHREAPEWRAQAFERLSAGLEVPMMVLAFVMIPVLIVPLVVHNLSPSTRNALEALDYLIWGAFFLEYSVKLALAPNRRQFIRKNIPDLIVVAVPFLRPLRLVRSVRALRFLRLTRLGAFAGEGAKEAKKSLHSRSANYVLVVTGLIVLLTSVMVLDLERTAHDANIRSFGDALWWAVSTVTTVGYGDHFPVTPGGRAVAVILMMAGIALFGVLTAALAAFFVENSASGRSEAQMLEEVLSRLETIEGQLNGGTRVLGPEPSTTESARAAGTSTDAAADLSQATETR
jgi:voltage-gated potassium channel